MSNVKIKYILVFAPSYNENIGGVIMLHKFCHLLNEAGVNSFIFPFFDNSHESMKKISRFDKQYLENKLLKNGRLFQKNDTFNTPLLKDISFLDNLDNWVIVYPEIVSGNPIGAKNVIRWFLHYPGFHTKIINYGENELYFKVSSNMKDFSYKNSVTSKTILKFLHYPLELYNMNNVSSERSGTAYCLHKGKNKVIEHDLGDSILIDGKSHAEIAQIFKKVSMFISYDAHTSYNAFAILCGCKTVVIKDYQKNEKTWKRDLQNPYGIVYGLENSHKAEANPSALLKDIFFESQGYEKVVKSFLLEMNTFFG